MELAVIIPVLAMSDEMIRARIELLRERPCLQPNFIFIRANGGLEQLSPDATGSWPEMRSCV